MDGHTETFNQQMKHNSTTLESGSNEDEEH